MQASKVTIAPETLAKTKLSASRREELRTHGVIALIKTKPAGTRIKYSQFAAVTGHATSQGAKLFIDKLIAKGIIGKTQEGIKSFSYSVIREPEDQPASVPEAAVEEKPTTPAETPDRDIEALAKHFAWQYNSDSLREFIKWLAVK